MNRPDALRLLLSFPIAGALRLLADAAPSAGNAGLAAQFVNDIGIERHPAVVFTEDFENPDLKARWQVVSAVGDGGPLAFDRQMQSPGAPGGTSMRFTAIRGKNEGGALYKVLKLGYDELFARLYVRFDEKHGAVSHFVKLGGDKDVKNWWVGRAGTRPDTWFMTGLEPTGYLTHTWPGKSYPLPGFWSFYSYWPEMHSWQTEDGSCDGKPNAYYGNRFAPADPAPIPRGVWTCIEWSLKLNSAPDKADGSQRFWIDGTLVGEWGPGTPVGYWMRENFRIRPDQPDRQRPFAGFRWRTDMGVKINIFKLENYVTEGSWKSTDGYAKEHPDFPLDTESATVWFDHVVVATEYIGPLAGAKP